MYFPYFRGKQFELLTIRESAPLLSAAGFTPIIEPVKETLTGLEKSLDAVCEAKGNAVVIVNPRHGDHKKAGDDISILLKDNFIEHGGISVGILLGAPMSVDEAKKCIKQHAKHPLTLIHAGFLHGKELAAELGATSKTCSHVFFKDLHPKTYRKHFPAAMRILLHDGFKRRERNRDYPEVEFFSDLHVTYSEEEAQGFGDFLTVGDEFSESGGPAYAVAIHMTFIDPTKDDGMFIYHFVSKNKQLTPEDPAGKFSEALDLLIAKADKTGSHIFESTAMAEFRELHAQGHFPGLGYVKKLSMKHHIETLKHYSEM